MNCFVCNEDYENKDLNSLLTCKHCAKFHLEDKARHAEYKKLINLKKKQLKKYGRENRKNITKSCHDAKLIIKEIMSAFGYHVTHEKVFFPYIADFYIKEIKCIIEIDGGVHETQLGYDDKRDSWLKDKYQCYVIRFDNKDVNSDMFRKAMWELAEKFLNNRIKKINKLAEDYGKHGYKLIKSENT
jgi:very-short-patch-repair endonuclease